MVELRCCMHARINWCRVGWRRSTRCRHREGGRRNTRSVSVVELNNISKEQFEAFRTSGAACPLYNFSRLGQFPIFDMGLAPQGSEVAAEDIGCISLASVN